MAKKTATKKKRTVDLKKLKALTLKLAPHIRYSPTSTEVASSDFRNLLTAIDEMGATNVEEASTTSEQD